MPIRPSLDTVADIAINDGDVTSTATTFNLLNSGVTTLNLGGEVTSLNALATSGVLTLAKNATLKLSGSTSGTVGLKAAAAAGSTTYTLPSADGSANQILTTNGSAVLSWSSPAAAVWG